MIRELGLDRHPAFARPDLAAGADETTAEADARYRARTASRLLAGLSVDPIEGTELLNITYVGTDPRPQQSGSSLKLPGTISRRGNKRLRTLLYMASLSASRYNSACS